MYYFYDRTQVLQAYVLASQFQGRPDTQSIDWHPIHGRPKGRDRTLAMRKIGKYHTIMAKIVNEWSIGTWVSDVLFVSYSL